MIVMPVVLIGKWNTLTKFQRTRGRGLVFTRDSDMYNGELFIKDMVVKW